MKASSSAATSLLPQDETQTKSETQSRVCVFECFESCVAVAPDHKKTLAQKVEQCQLRTGQDRTHQSGTRPNCYCPQYSWLTFVFDTDVPLPLEALEQSILPPPNGRQVLRCRRRRRRCCRRCCRP
ncbi:hypothetical protein ACLKA7_016697 [Drosophila subpalustris]